MRGKRTIRLKKGTRRTVGITLLASFLVIVVLIRNGKEAAPVYDRNLSKVDLSVEPLEGTFRSEGIIGFRRQKEMLKAEVSSAMAHGDPRAEPFAVYLFPELLPDSHFEKSVATESWIPLQARIEANPGSDDSKQSFEEMRAQIWIYENPDRKHPVLSDTADEIVKLYALLSGK